MHEPVGFERGGKPLLAFQDRRPAEHAGAGEILDADYAPCQITARNGDRIVGRVVVNEVYLNALAEEIFETVGDETLLVVSGQDCYYTHGCCRSALESSRPA